MNGPGYKITVDELETLMRQALVQCGFPADYQTRYVEAHRNCGWLRPGTPQAILDLAEIHYTLPSAESLGPVIPPMPAKRHRPK